MKKLIVAIALMFACITCGQAYAGSPVVLKPISSAKKVTKVSKPKQAKKAKPVQQKYSAHSVVKSPVQK